MWSLKYVFLGFVGASFGFAVAGGYLALISMIGILPRLASTTKTANRMVTYENSLIYGVLAGNISYIYDFTLPFGGVIRILVGLFGGIFVGCLAGALAEIVNVIPIFLIRAKLRTGIPYIIYALALGKALGAFVQYFL